MTVINLLVGFLTGIISGFGVGGGSLLVLYLTVFGGVDQYTAGGITCYTLPAALPRRLSHTSAISASCGGQFSPAF